jgi:hypothetical protein
MSNGIRLWATLIIWIIFAILSGTVLTSVTGPIATASENTLFNIIALFAATAGISTAAVWFGGWQVSRAETEARRAKTKRQMPSRVRRLIDDLEEDEIYELEALLLSREDHTGNHASQR